MVPPSSHGISRVPQYSGFSPLDSDFRYLTFTIYGQPSQTVLLSYPMRYAVHTPEKLLLPVWPLSLSLATTQEISVDFFSSSYLDVSVRKVPSTGLWIHPAVARHDSCGVSPFGHPRINAYLLLPEAYRSLSRPSSAPNAKAFSLCSSLLELIRIALSQDLFFLT